MKTMSSVIHKPYTFNAIDTHTMGEPTRIVVKGFPDKENASSMIEKKKFLEEEYDVFRKSLILEPRGHSDMFGAVICKPVHDEADLGVIFMDSDGYLNMCGHGSIGVATVAIETGLVKVEGSFATVTLDTPAGIVTTEVKVEDNKAKEVSLTNIPSFVFIEDYMVDVDGIGQVPVDVSFGGSFFAIVNEEDIHEKIDIKNIDRLTDIAMEIKDKLNKELTIKHPYLDITTVDLVEFYGKATNPSAQLKNVVIFGNRQVDRSPCGTGTSAKLATLYQKGKIDINEPFIYESITGSLFRGEVIEVATVDHFKGVIPRITGSAFITGHNELIIHPDDPLKYGFSLRV